MNLTALDTSTKWYHVIFVLLCLGYFTNITSSRSDIFLNVLTWQSPSNVLTRSSSKSLGTTGLKNLQLLILHKYSTVLQSVVVVTFSVPCTLRWMLDKPEIMRQDPATVAQWPLQGAELDWTYIGYITSLINCRLSFMLQTSYVINIKMRGDGKYYF